MITFRYFIIEKKKLKWKRKKHVQQLVVDDWKKIDSAVLT